MSTESGAALSGKSPRYSRVLSLLLLIASPVVIMFLLSLMSGQNMFLSKPIFNDEMGYWRLMYSISERGFDFGSTEHLVGYVAPYGPLGSHGLSPVAAWLWYVLLFPMTDSALVIAGVIMLAAAFLLLYLIVRPGVSEMLLIALFTLLYPPLVRYINLSMMEMPCYACVIVYMALLLRYEKEHSGALPHSRWTLPLLFVCGLYCTLLRWSGEGRTFKAALAALLVFGMLMAPEAYRHVAQDPRFYPDESTGLDYSELFGDEACTLGLYGTAYELALMKDVPANVGICGGIYEENTHGYGMDYILSLPGDPTPSPEYYQHYATMEGYGELYRRLES